MVSECTLDVTQQSLVIKWLMDYMCTCTVHVYYGPESDIEME